MRFKKGASEIFMEMAVIIVVLAIVGFIISQTLMRTSPSSNSLSGSAQEIERGLASKISNCWLENSAKPGWQACYELKIPNGNISRERVEQLASCGCKVKWGVEQNFTKTLINYDGFNRQVIVELIRE